GAGHCAAPAGSAPLVYIKEDGLFAQRQHAGGELLELGSKRIQVLALLCQDIRVLGVRLARQLITFLREFFQSGNERSTQVFGGLCQLISMSQIFVQSVQLVPQGKEIGGQGKNSRRRFFAVALGHRGRRRGSG